MNDKAKVCVKLSTSVEQEDNILYVSHLNGGYNNYSIIAIGDNYKQLLIKTLKVLECNYNCDDCTGINFCVVKYITKDDEYIFNYGNDEALSVWRVTFNKH